MHQECVEGIDSQLAAESLDVGLGHLGMLGRGLGLEEVAVAGHALEGQTHEGVHLVGVGRVDIAQAAIQGVAHQPGERLLAHLQLLAAAAGAGADAQHRGLDAGLTQGD